MKYTKTKILILSNSAIGLCCFRKELFEKLIAENYDVSFCVPESANDEYVIEIVNLGAEHFETPIDRRSVNPLKDLNLIKDYKRIIIQTKPDVVLTYTVKPNIYGTYSANKLKVPVIMNVTGIGTSMISHRLRSLVRFLYKQACSRANVVFFQNQTNLDFFAKNNLVDMNKTQLIPGSGVNLDKFRPVEKTINDGKIRFLFIGRLMKEKGIEEYLKAAQNISKKYPHTIFQIVGLNEELKYNSLIENNNSIEYLGPSKDVREQIREADCIINPSYHEGMSNVLQEGAAMGKPLIASNIPGCKEIVEDGKNGFLFEVKNAADLENKIIQFIELSEEQKVSMGKYSRLKVEKEFDRKIVVEEYMKAINCVLGI